MRSRKRVNISLDAHTYNALSALVQEYGFRSVCEVVTAMVHVMIDRTDNARILINEDDSTFIDGMFNELVSSDKNENRWRRSNGKG